MNPVSDARSTAPIQPGLMVVHGNRLEDLRDLLLTWLARTPLAPLENEQVLVQSNGIAQWLKLALARPPDAGGLGISAAVDMQLPGRFLWQAYRAVLGPDEVPAASPFDKSRLAWRLMRLLPAHLDEETFSPLRHFLDADDGTDVTRQFQLANQIADLFDQYQVYRADWLDDWAHGHDVMRDDLRQRREPLPMSQRWQAKLWRLLLADLAPAQRHSHRAAVHQAFLERMGTLHRRPATLPRRIVVFGISSLPQQTLEVLTGLGRICQVLLLVTNPCRHYWADIIEDRELLMASQRRQAGKPGLPTEPDYAELHLHANPLLAAWGKQGRDYIRLLDSFDRPDAYRPQFAALGRDIDLFDDPGSDSLLHQVQQAVLDLEPLPLDPARRQAWRDNDASLRFHVAHNPQREIEILHDQLLAMFEAAERRGTPLAPRDVMVMVPDIQTYTPHIQAVFGRLPPDDPRYLPCSIADRPSRGTAPLLVALEHLLRLPESRFSVGEILDLLDAPALRRRFGLDDNDLPVLRNWIEGSGIRWGLDGEQKTRFGLPPLEQNSWRFGLRRMLLGYAVGDGPSLDGIAPHADVGGLEAALVGPLDALLERLEHHGQQLAMPATPGAWCVHLRALLADFFDAGRDDDDLLRLERLDDALDQWEQACSGADFSAPLPLAVVREHWLGSIDEHRLSQRFLGGAISFGTLLPMRAIPFRVVCLLGMNDGDYPRRQHAPDIDLMALPGQQRPGDRSRREDDRYLWLEALLSARETLHVSWVGRSARDNSPLPPSTLVGQLRDYLAAGWHCAGDHPDDPKAGQRLLDALTTDYPLQPFSRRYFETGTGLFTYAAEWAQAHRAASSTEHAPLAPWVPETGVDLGLLQRFLRAPARTFYAERLRVNFASLDELDDDSEPFALDALQRHGVTDVLLRTAITEGNDALAATAIRLREEGILPPGDFGTLVLAPIETAAAQAGSAWRSLVARWPQAADVRELRYEADGLTVEDWLGDLRHDANDGLVRLIGTASPLLDKNTPRYDKLLDAWVAHLLGNANGLRLTTHVVAPDATVELMPLPVDAASRHLDALLAGLRQGMQSPLPIARRTAYAWLLAEADGKKPPYDVARTRYDHSDSGWSHGEVDSDACLARDWPDFARLHAAGFERWLHLYRPLLDAVQTTGHTP
ncbi:exodeoxyribonuclease V subunit gamma [Dyella sp. A6]|uniref:exodeoxyribonuclease V subunit gamma n=1 Tax=Dyella aluminiiresistens TaxID=3069105 RepID=UPI002E7803DE|nr:exodeoxyribonuclease V subunit gamma [Dyella sp. A6]